LPYPAPEATSAATLRRLSIGELLNLGFGLARYRLWFLVVTAAWAIVPGFLVSVALAIAVPSAVVGSLPTFLAVLAAVPAALLACGSILDPTVLPLGSDPVAIYRTVLKRTPALLVVGVLVVLLVVPTFVILPFGVFLAVRWSMVVSAVVLEGRSALTGLRETWRLTRGSFWQIFGVLVVVAMLALVVNFIVEGVFVASGAAIFTVARSPSTALVVGNLANSLGALVVIPFAAAINIVLFYELNARYGSIDLLVRARRPRGG